MTTAYFVPVPVTVWSLGGAQRNNEGQDSMRVFVYLPHLHVVGIERGVKM